jgi:hypothetical protein
VRQFAASSSIRTFDWLKFSYPHHPLTQLVS